MPIVRDATFTRVVADSALIMNLGRDYDLAFLQHSSEPRSIAFLNNEGKMGVRSTSTGVVNEVVRVRMSPESASQMAMQILDALIKANQVVNEMVLENVQKMIANAQSEVSE